MAFQSILAADIDVDKFVTEDLMNIIKDNFDYLYGHSLAAIGIINGSFEIDSDADGLPDSWDVELYAGGSFALDTTYPAHGAKSATFTHPGGEGNGGGYLTSDYFPVSNNTLPNVIVNGVLWASAAGMKLEVIIKWYTAALVHISDTTLYSSTANPTSFSHSLWSTKAPSTARFAKLMLIGGKDDTDVAGTAYFDNFDVALDNMHLMPHPADSFLLGTAPDSDVIQPRDWTKVVELQCTCAGNFRIAHSLYLGGAAAYSRIYRNGSPVGAINSLTTSGVLTPYSEDLYGWQLGDKLQIYVNCVPDEGSGIGDMAVTDIMVKGDVPAVAFANTL